MAGLQTNEDESGLGDEDSSDEISVPAVNRYSYPVMRRDAQEKEHEMLRLKVNEMNRNFKMITKRFYSLQGSTASRNTDEELMPLNVLSKTGEISTRMKRGKCLDNQERNDNISTLVDTINKFATRIDNLDHRLGKGNFRLCGRLCCHEHSKSGSGSKSCNNIHKLDGDYKAFENKPSNQGTHKKIKGAVGNDPWETKSDSKIVEFCELLPTEEPHGSEKQNMHASSIDKLAGKPKTDDEKQPASNMNLVNVQKQMDIREVENIKVSFGEGNSCDRFIRINSSGLKSMKTDPQEDNRQKRIEEDVQNSAQVKSERHSNTYHSCKADIETNKYAQSKGDTNFTNRQKKGLSLSSNARKTDEKPNKGSTLIETVRSADENRSENGDRTRSEHVVSGAAKTLTKANASSMVPTHLPVEYWESVCQETYDKALNIRKSRSIGFDTIICLDTSASVSDHWGDILIFLRNLINEIETVQPMEGGLMEHIALVTYGHQTAVLQHFTTKYQDVLKQIHTIYPDDSTPMHWAVIMCKVILLGSAYAPQLRGLRLSPRILLITDGRPSNRLLTGGRDESQKYDEDMEKEDIARQLIVTSLQIPLLRVYAVAVGNDCDKEFLTAITHSCGGKVTTLSDWSSLAQYGKKMELASKYYGLASLSQDLLVNVLREKSGLPQEDIEFVTSEVKEQLEYRNEEGTTSDEEEVQGTYQLPPVGSRVRRGPQWNRNDEDNDSPGTIIAYSKGKALSGWIIVEWDQPKKYSRWRFNYRYGAENAYDVKVRANEGPRVMEFPNLMKVGCEVIRVGALKTVVDGVKEGTVGMVYDVNIMNKNAIKVRWENGKRWIYNNEALLSGAIGLSLRSHPYHNGFDPSQFLRNLSLSVNQQGTDVSRPQPRRQGALPPGRRQLSTRELQNPGVLHNEGNDSDFTEERELLTIEDVERGGMPFVDDMNGRNLIHTRTKERKNKETLCGTRISSDSKTRNDQKEVTKSNTNGNTKLRRMKRSNKNAHV